MEGPKVVARMYDFLRWAVPHISKFPRNQRYTLGLHIENKLLFLMDAVIDAQYSRDKSKILKKANLAIEQIRYLFRLSYDLHMINIKIYERSSRYLREIGVQIGGWLKQQAQSAKTSSSL